MECYYHPDREGTDTCAICGKSICKECGLEIAGKQYCKECLEKIVGVGIENQASQPANEPARLNKQPVEENIYQTQGVEQTPAAPEPTPEIKQISDDSPYNIKDNMEYNGGLETSYINENEPVQPRAEQPQVAPEPQITQNEPEYIYPDHSYEPEPTSARLELEDKYEKYLDDLYFDEKEVPLGEQLAKDEEEFGSLTRKPYTPREEPPLQQKRERAQPPKNETPEQMEARIRAEILAEKDGGKIKDKNIHKLNYQEEKESMSGVDILLTIILILVILVVIYYLIYIFTLTTYYPTFMDAIYGLTNPQNVINNILTPPQ